MFASKVIPQGWEKMEVLCLANIAVPGGRKLLGCILAKEGDRLLQRVDLLLENRSATIPTGLVVDVRPLDVLILHGQLVGEEALVFDPWSLEIPRRMSLMTLQESQIVAGKLICAKDVTLCRLQSHALTFKGGDAFCSSAVCDPDWMPDEDSDLSLWQRDSAFLLMGKHPSHDKGEAVLAVL